MEKTEIKVELTIYHDSKLNHQEITEIIGFEPTFICNKGDEIRRDLYRKESVWKYSTENLKSLYLEDILDLLIQKLNSSVVPLSIYIKEHDLNSKFDIVIRIVDNQSPSHYLPKRFIHLCSMLNADVDTDILF